MRKPKHQTKKKKRKKKKKTKKQTSHHQSLIQCKRCEIPCYYQQIKYINSSNVKNTFGFLWKKLRKRSGRSVWLAHEALRDRDMATWVSWAQIDEIVREEVRAVRDSFSLWWYWTRDERSMRWEISALLKRVVEESIKRSASRVLLQLWGKVCSVIYENAIENKVMVTENTFFSFHNSSFKNQRIEWWKQ